MLVPALPAANAPSQTQLSCLLPQNPFQNIQPLASSQPLHTFPHGTLATRKSLTHLFAVTILATVCHERSNLAWLCVTVAAHSADVRRRIRT